ncbi:MAG: prepilin-type N-terminal cleavage/methylation domain-containing protein [Candidatus Omnitrophota bacterium]|nr:prepilin-type N-terminal cleavage/methylation domain-containing protein [Candidatus Omnitrophota bacterium]
MAALKPKRPSKAFSLLELIIAVTILAAGIVVVLQALSYSARMAGLSIDTTFAALLAADKMQELDFKESQGTISGDSLQVKDKNGKFNWEYGLSLDTNLNLYKLDFNVTWQRRDREEKINLASYIR